MPAFTWSLTVAGHVKGSQSTRRTNMPSKEGVCKLQCNVPLVLQCINCWVSTTVIGLKRSNVVRKQRTFRLSGWWVTCIVTHWERKQKCSAPRRRLLDELPAKSKKKQSAMYCTIKVMKSNRLGHTVVTSSTLTDDQAWRITQEGIHRLCKPIYQIV